MSNNETNNEQEYNDPTTPFVKVAAGILIIAVFFFGYWKSNYEQVDGWIHTLTGAQDQYLLGVNMSTVSKEYIEHDLHIGEHRTMLRRCTVNVYMANSNRQKLLNEQVCKAMAIHKAKGSQYSEDEVRGRVQSFLIKNRRNNV